jgi:hypothetical protein
VSGRATVQPNPPRRQGIPFLLLDAVWFQEADESHVVAMTGENHLGALVVAAGDSFHAHRRADRRWSRRRVVLILLCGGSVVPADKAGRRLGALADRSHGSSPRLERLARPAQSAWVRAPGS